MLVCHVSLRPRGRAIAAEVAEVAEAIDASNIGVAIFATLVDDPASVADVVDAYLGEIMLEAASASDVFDAIASNASIDEAATAADAPDATVTAGTVTTWNPSDKAANATLSNANLTVASASSTAGARGTKGVTAGKAYFEITAAGSLATGSAMVGVANGSAVLTAGAQTGQIVVAMFDGSSFYNGGGSGLTALGAIAAGNVVCVAIDFTNKRLWFRRNADNWNASAGADPATNTGGLNVSTMLTGVSIYPFAIPTSSPANNFTGNFGASAFAQSVPSGFTAWNSV